MEDNTQQLEHNRRSFVERQGISPLLFAFLALLIIFLLYQVIGGLITLIFLGKDVTQMDVTVLRFSTGLAQLLLILVPTIFLSKLLSTDFLETFKIKKISPTIVILTIIGTLSLQEILQILLLIQEQIPLPAGISEVASEFKQLIEESYRIIASANSYPEFSFVVIIIAIIPAFSEEFLFRGLLQHNFILGLGSKWGIIIGGIIFGLYHFNPFAILPLILLGIYFGFLVYRSGSIFPSIIAHFTNNFLASALFFYLGKEEIMFKKSNDIITIQESFGILIVFSFSLTIFLISLYYFIKLTSKNNPQTLS